MQVIRQHFSRFITATILFLIGLICFFSGIILVIDTSETIYTVNALLLFVGIPIILVSSFVILASLLNAFITTNEQSFAGATIGAGAALGAGIFIVANKNAGSLILSFVDYLPYFVIVEGLILLIDSAFNYVYGYRIKRNKPALYTVIIELAVSVIALTLGFLSLYYLDEEVQLIIFGIVLMLYAIFVILQCYSIVPSSSIITQASTPKDVVEEVEEVEEIEEDE
jgi:hypothetical protein